MLFRSDAVAKLTGDDYGNLSYGDDLSTSRWQHLGSFSTSHESHCGRRGSEFWIGLKGGFAISGQLLQRFSALRRLKQLPVHVNLYAHAPDLAFVLQLFEGLQHGIADPRDLWNPVCILVGARPL